MESATAKRVRPAGGWGGVAGRPAADRRPGDLPAVAAADGAEHRIRLRPSAPPRPPDLDTPRLGELEPAGGAGLARATGRDPAARVVRGGPPARRHRRILDQCIAVGLVGWKRVRRTPHDRSEFA